MSPVNENITPKLPIVYRQTHHNKRCHSQYFSMLFRKDWLVSACMELIWPSNVFTCECRNGKIRQISRHSRPVSFLMGANMLRIYWVPDSNLASETPVPCNVYYKEAREHPEWWNILSDDIWYIFAGHHVGYVNNSTAESKGQCQMVWSQYLYIININYSTISWSHRAHDWVHATFNAISISRILSQRSNHSKLEPSQILHNLSSSNIRSSPESWQVQGAAQAVCKSKEQHRWNPSSCVLQSEALVIHLILLDCSTVKVVNATLRINFWLKASRSVSQLGSNENMEVIIGCVATGMAFGSNSGTCDTS